MQLDQNYWENRYVQKSTGWDLAKVSSPLFTYFKQLKNKDIKILIPGGGFNHEAEYLFKNGFKNVFIAEFSKTALIQFKERNPSFPKEQLLEVDFFLLKDKFDLIIEQTFFCALDPSSREKYVEQMYSLLTPNGKLVGLLFDRMFETNPPFGGNKSEYLKLFSTHFNISIMEDCYNSENARMGTELFIKFLKL
ncbi:MAG: methyltransferase domain-containing protein [Lishizhenia sp.]